MAIDHSERAETKGEQGSDDSKGHGKPVLAYLAGGLGLLLTLGLVALIGRDALVEAPDEVPFVTVAATGIHPVGGGYEVRFEARNLTSQTASNVQIEATLDRPGDTPLVSTVSIDYVPGHSKHKGGVFLPVDPASGKLELRAHGYAEP